MPANPSAFTLRPRPGESAADLAARLPAELVVRNAAGQPLHGSRERSLLPLDDPALRLRLAERMLAEQCSLASVVNGLLAQADDDSGLNATPPPP